MKSNAIMVISSKETMLIRVLNAKLRQANLNSFYIPCDLSMIDGNWERVGLVIFYLEKYEEISYDTLHFIVDRLQDSNKRCMVIEDADTNIVLKDIPKSLIYSKFYTPLDYSRIIDSINEYFQKVDSNELKRHILIVDDDPNYVGTIREWLKFDYRVSAATSGLRAITWLANNKVDLILLDYEMPVTSGKQVLEMLRDDEELCNIPVFFLTGHDDSESVMAAMTLKPEGYVLKSTSKVDLLERLKLFFLLK